jgi:hypothetical protein
MHIVGFPLLSLESTLEVLLCYATYLFCIVHAASPITPAHNPSGGHGTWLVQLLPAATTTHVRSGHDVPL